MNRWEAVGLFVMKVHPRHPDSLSTKLGTALSPDEARRIAQAHNLEVTAMDLILEEIGKDLREIREKLTPLPE